MPPKQSKTIIQDEQTMSQKTTIRVKTIPIFKNGESYRVIHGDCISRLKAMPSNTVNCVITSPPYWKMREYSIDAKQRKYLIGNESNPDYYVEKLVNVFKEVYRIIRPDGSLWLNLGDKYLNKDKVGLPWAVALALKREGWILRDDIIWNKMKGTQSSKDRTRSLHEYLFHFVKSKQYFYDYKKILVKPKVHASIKNGKVISATGVSGKKYREQIKHSKMLSLNEKKMATHALDQTIKEMKQDKIIDFRMTVRGGQRTLHGNKESISGRAKELKDKGFFIIKMSADGFLPSSIWNIVPEDIWRTDEHYAVFPMALLRIPILATCPAGGVVLDPFMGTGSSLLAAVQLGRRGVGIEISSKYITTAKTRLTDISIR